MAGFKYPISGSVEVLIPDNFVATTIPPSTPGATEDVMITTVQRQGNLAGNSTTGAWYPSSSPLNPNFYNIGYDSVNRFITFKNVNLTSVSSVNVSIAIHNGFTNTLFETSNNWPSNTNNQTAFANWNFWGNTSPGGALPADTTPAPAAVEANLRYAGSVRVRFEKQSDGANAEILVVDANTGVTNSSGFTIFPVSVPAPLQTDNVTVKVFQYLEFGGTVDTQNSFTMTNWSSPGSAYGYPGAYLVPTPQAPSAANYIPIRRFTTEAFRVGYQYLQVGSTKYPFNGVKRVRTLSSGEPFSAFPAPTLPAAGNLRVAPSILRFPKGPEAGDHGIQKFSWNPASPTAWEIQANVANFDVESVIFTSPSVDPADETSSMYSGNQPTAFNVFNKNMAMKGSYASLSTLSANMRLTGPFISVSQRLRFASEIVDTVGDAIIGQLSASTGPLTTYMGFTPSYGPVAATASLNAFPGARQEGGWYDFSSTYVPANDTTSNLGIPGFTGRDQTTYYFTPSYPVATDPTRYLAPGGNMGAAMPLIVAPAVVAGGAHYADGYFSPSAYAFNLGWYRINNNSGAVYYSSAYYSHFWGHSSTHGFAYKSVGISGTPATWMAYWTPGDPTNPQITPLPTANRIRSNAYRFPFANYFEITEFADGITTATGGGTFSSTEAMYVMGGAGPADMTYENSTLGGYYKFWINDTNAIVKIPFSVGPSITISSVATSAYNTSYSAGVTDGYSAYYMGVSTVAYSAPLLGTTSGDIYYFYDGAPYVDATPAPLGGLPYNGYTVHGSRRLEKLPFASDTATINFGIIDPGTYTGFQLQSTSSPTKGYLASRWVNTGVSGLGLSYDSYAIVSFPFAVTTTIAGFATGFSTGSGNIDPARSAISRSQSEYNSYGGTAKFNFATETHLSRIQDIIPLGAGFPFSNNPAGSQTPDYFWAPSIVSFTTAGVGSYLLRQDGGINQ